MLKIEIRSEKRYKEQIEENFLKHQEESKVNDDFDDVQSTHENSLRDSKKPQEVAQVEDEYNALMQTSLVLRRGRANRCFAKYV